MRQAKLRFPGTLVVWRARADWVVRAEVLGARVFGLQGVWAAGVEDDMVSEASKTTRKMVEQLSPCKLVAQVEAWRRFYIRCNPMFHVKMTRFKFLVLEDDSKYGKTHFARNL